MTRETLLLKGSTKNHRRALGILGVDFKRLADGALRFDGEHVTKARAALYLVRLWETSPGLRDLSLTRFIARFRVP